MIHAYLLLGMETRRGKNDDIADCDGCIANSLGTWL